MRILPVIDLMHGVVVRGIAGRRENYRPIATPLSATPEPTAIAEAFRRHFGLSEIYIADLDAIAGRPPACELYRRLGAEGVSLWVDAGLRVAEDAKCLFAVGVDRIIAGLETLKAPEELARLSEVCPTEQIVLSLDLREGRLIAPPAWEGMDEIAIIKRVAEHGVQQVIVLDVARVGVSTGTGTETLCKRLVQEFPSVSFFAGGGVRGPADLERLCAIGVKGVLVASALHDGGVSAEDLKLALMEAF